MARRNNEHTISDLVDLALERAGLDDVAVSGRVTSAYRKVVGPMIEKLTYNVHYEPQTHVLYVRLASPALRQELKIHASGLLESINAQIGRAEVRYIVFR